MIGYTYNARNQQISYSLDGATLASYTYNPDGLRRSKHVLLTLEQRYIWSGDSMVYECELLYPANGTVYVYGINPISSRNSDLNDIFYLYNAHGDVVQLVYADGIIAQTYNYDAFGVEYDIDEDDGNPFRYCGEYFDKETGTIYLRARYYDPATSRMLSEDTVRGVVRKMPNGQEIIDPLSLNLYTYAYNNPILYVDPSGHVITLSSTATKTEKEQYDRAIEYLKTSKDGKALIEKLENATEVFTIMFVYDDNMYYDPNTREIFFDIYSGLITGDGTSVQSAALGLAHEMGHGAQHLDGGMDAFLKDPTQKNRDELEAANLKLHETPIAKQLGEPTRKNYNDVSGLQRMNNSTHFRTTTTRPWWHYIAPWNWGKPGVISIDDHNAK